MIFISFISDNNLLIERVKLFSIRYGDFFTFFYNKKPVFDNFFDIMVSPDEYLNEISNFKRENNFFVPFIIYGDGSNLAYSFQCGAIDFLKNPWKIEELGYRILNYLKNGKNIFQKRDITVNKNSLEIGNKFCHISRKEFLLLRLLILHHGRLVHKNLIWNVIWNKQPDKSKALDMLILRLRKKIASIDGSKKLVIRSIKRIGYIYDDIEFF